MKKINLILFSAFFMGLPSFINAQASETKERKLFDWYLSMGANRFVNRPLDLEKLRELEPDSEIVQNAQNNQNPNNRTRMRLNPSEFAIYGGVTFNIKSAFNPKYKTKLRIGLSYMESIYNYTSIRSLIETTVIDNDFQLNGTSYTMTSNRYSIYDFWHVYDLLNIDLGLVFTGNMNKRLRMDWGINIESGRSLTYKYVSMQQADNLSLNLRPNNPVITNYVSRNSFTENSYTNERYENKGAFNLFATVPVTLNLKLEPQGFLHQNELFLELRPGFHYSRFPVLGNDIRFGLYAGLGVRHLVK